MGNINIRSCAFIGIITLLMLLEGKESVFDGFCYETDSYRYEMNSDYDEVFSFVTEDGTYLDTFAGGGTYQMIDADTGFCNVSTSVISYEESRNNGITSFKVNYEMLDGAEAYTIYTFHDKYVEVEAVIKDIDRYDTVEGALLKRELLSDCEETEKKLATSWDYPSDGDFPYKKADSIVTTYLFDAEYKLFSFVRGSDGARQVLFEEYSETDIPVPIENQELREYTITYDLVFENTKNGRDADCFALFEGKDSEFAARIDVLEENDSNVAIYETDELTLQIKLANLVSERISTKVKCDVYAYDGELVSQRNTEIFLQKEEECEIPITITTKKRGMFYLDLQVESEQSSYREFFPFAMMTPYEYQNTEDNPFGISGVRFGEYEPNDDTLWIMEKLGVSNARICFSEGDYIEKDYTLLIKYLKQMQNRKIRIDGQYLLLSGWRMPTADTADDFERELDMALGQVAKYLDSCEVGNEYNLYADNQNVGQAMQDYLQIYFEPGSRMIKQKYGIEIAGASVGLSRTDWLEEMVSCGMYERMDILKTHAYGFPYSPDYSNDQSIDLVVESALARTRAFLDQYGNKTWYVDEIGFPTTANAKAGVSSGNDLRSQADYMIRALALGVAYGADSVSVYSLYDQLNLFKGVSDTDNEFNFGLFYAPDYYGRILPKPSAVAYANLTRMLDGVSSGSEIETESDTVRAFCFYAEENKEPIYVAWSNCSRLSNDTGDNFVRTPNLPWQNQWSETETCRFYLQGESIEVTDSMGNQSVLPITDGYVEIELDGSPKYIIVK